MKITVHHDEQGTITLVSVAREDGDVHVVVHPAPGQRVSEVEAPSVQHARDIEHLREIREHYRVEMQQGVASLVPR